MLNTEGLTPPQIILLLVTFISVFGLVRLRAIIDNEIEEVTSSCQYYNETKCNKDNNCDVEHTKICEKNHPNHCYVIWSNSTAGGLRIISKGCFSDKNCNGKKRCVEQGLGKNNLYYCCCQGNMCNRDFFLETTPPPPVSLSSEPVEEETSNIIVVFAMLPVAVACILTIAFVYRKQKLTYTSQVPLTDEDDPPDQDKLRPIELDEVRARGRFGAVWKARYKEDIVAVKILAAQEKQSWKVEQDIFKLPLMNHENILQFIGAEKRGDSSNVEYWIITAYHELGSLCDFLRNNTITWEQLCHIALSMTRGLTHLHEEIHCDKEYKPSIAHRDFKSNNVLLKNDLTACIADFGLAIVFEPHQQCGDTHGQVGTGRYMAPEVLEGAINFSRDSFLRIDMYSCALVLWELLSRCSTHQNPLPEYKLPFEEEVGQHPTIKDMQDVVVYKKMRPTIKECWKSHSGFSILCDTIEECWDDDAEARLSASCVLERIRPTVTSSVAPSAVIVTNHLHPLLGSGAQS